MSRKQPRETVPDAAPVERDTADAAPVERDTADAAPVERDQADRGASSLEWALLTPILILVLLVVVQFAMVYHARHVALAAAQSGARVARTQPVGADWEGPAVAKAQGDIDKIGSNLLSGRRVTPLTGGGGDQRGIEVSGTAVRVIPFMTFRVSQRSQGPIECFRPDEGTGVQCQGAAG